MNGKTTYSATRLAILNEGKSWQITGNTKSRMIQGSGSAQYALFDMHGRLLQKGSLGNSGTIIKPVAGAVYILQLQGNGRTERRILR